MDKAVITRLKEARGAFEGNEKEHQGFQSRSSEAEKKKAAAAEKEALAKKELDAVMQKFAVGGASETDLDVARKALNSASAATADAGQIVDILNEKIKELRGPKYDELREQLRSATAAFWIAVKKDLQSRIASKSFADFRDLLVTHEALGNGVPASLQDLFTPHGGITLFRWLEEGEKAERKVTLEKEFLGE